MSGVARAFAVCTCLAAGGADAGDENYVELRTVSAASAMSATPQGFTGSMGYGGSAHGQAVSLGWTLGERLAFELSMRDYGNYDGGSTLCPVGVGCTQNVGPAQGEAEGRAATLVYGWPLAGRVALQARGGFQRWSTEVSSGFERARESGTDGIFGLALQWRPLPALSFTLGIEDHELADHGAELGVRVHF